MKFSYTPARLAVLGLAASLSFASWAQSGALLSEVVVTATRAEQPLTDVVADVTVLDRGDIEKRGVSTLNQLLSELPGLQVLDAGGIHVRGAETRMTALYIDGVRIDSHDGANTLGGGAPWELVPLAQVDRVEILRGPASAVYGSDAMGGVIQVFTTKAQKNVVTRANVGLGNRNTWRMGAAFSGASGAWDYSIGVNKEGTSGHDTRPDIAQIPNREGSRQSSLSLRLGREIAQGQRLELTHLNSELHSRYAPYDMSYNAGRDYDAFSRLTSTGLGWSATWSETFSTRLTVSQANVDRQDTQGYDYRTLRSTVLLDSRLKAWGGTFNLALERKKDEFDSFKAPYDPAFSGERRQDAVALGYGTRVGRSSVQVNLRSDDDQLFGRHQSGTLAYGYDLGQGWRLNTSAGTGFRAPTLEQVYSDYGSRTLRPETNASREVSLAYAVPGHSFKLAAYRNDFRDLISSGTTDCAAGVYGPFCYYNVGQARVEGVTLSGTTQLGRFALKGAMDWLDPKNEVTGKFLTLRPRQQAFLSVSRPWGVWDAGVHVRLVSRRYDNAANTVVLPGYGLLGLVASRPLAPNLNLVLRADNLGDRRYQQIGTLAMPGRTFFATLHWQSR